MEETQTQTKTQRKQRRAGMEQIRDAMKDIEATVSRLAETHSRILKSKLEGLETLVGKHCMQVGATPKKNNTTRKVKLSAIAEETEAEAQAEAEGEATVPVQATTATAEGTQQPEKMMSKARVIDQTFNEFRTAVSETMKTMGKPLTTEGSKAVSDAWKSAKVNNLKGVKDSLKTLGLPESYVSPMASRTVEEAQSYLARTQTRKVKATPLTPGKTRKVRMRKPKTMVVPPIDLDTIPETNTRAKREVEYEGKKYYVLGDNTVYEKNEDDSLGEAVGTWNEEDKVVVSL
jgi:hypothetical protein